MPKLYEVPNNTWVALSDQDQQADYTKNIFFDHIDGMYSYCKDINGNVIHLKAWTEVTIIEEGQT